MGTNVFLSFCNFCQCFDLGVVKSVTGDEYLDDPSTVLVVSDFRQGMFERLANIKW